MSTPGHPWLQLLSFILVKESEKIGGAMSIHKRGRYWYAYLRDPRTGKQITRSLKTTSKREAERRHAILLAEVTRHGAEAVSGSITVRDMLDKYLVWSKTNKKSWYRDQTSIRALLPRLGGIRLRDLRPHHIENYKAERLETVSNSTVNRELALLRHAFNQSRVWGLWSGENPMAGVRMLRENPARLRYLRKDEWERLYAAAAPHLKPLLLCLVSTGLRLGEALALTWDDVDMENCIIHVRDSKSGSPREVPVPRQLLDALTDLQKKHGSEGRVFRNQKGETWRWVRPTFVTACRKAGIEDFRLHDLRHTFASWQVMAGTPLRTLQELLGHKTLAMTMKYAHLAPSHLRATARVMEQFLG